MKGSVWLNYQVTSKLFNELFMEKKKFIEEKKI